MTSKTWTLIIAVNGYREEKITNLFINFTDTKSVDKHIDCAQLFLYIEDNKSFLPILIFVLYITE